MPGLGQAMIDIIAGTGYVEGMSPEWFLSLDHGFDIGHGPTPTAWIGEVGAVVGQNGVDLVRDCLDQAPQEVGRDTPRGLLMQLGEGELRGSVDSDEEIKPSHRSANLGDVDVEVSDRIDLELTLYTLAILDVRKPRERLLASAEKRYVAAMKEVEKRMASRAAKPVSPNN